MDGYEVADAMISGLWDDFEAELMKRKVERSFVDYCVAQVTEQSVLTLKNVMIEKDIGDICPDTKQPLYRYQEEEMEPEPICRDNHA